jgi:hypothetical protein
MDPLHAIYIAIWVLIAAGVFDKDANAATTNSISYQSGSDFRTGEKERNILTLDSLTKTQEDHIIYANIDIQSFDNQNSIVISRVLGRRSLAPFIRGSAQLINQRGVSSTDVGFGFDIPVGYTTGIDIFKHSDNVLGEGAKLQVYWVIPYQNWRFNGIVETIWADKMLASDSTLAQPEIMYTATKDLQFGVEYQIYRNKNGVSGLDETFPQVKLKYQF